MACNGWKNYSTWNAAQWMQDDPYYGIAVEFMARYRGRSPYRDFIKAFALEAGSTPDGVRWMAPSCNLVELNRMMFELRPSR